MCAAFPLGPQPFHVLAKPIGARCNLACRYCFYLEKEPLLYPAAASLRMSDATLEIFVRDYLAAQPGSEVTFTWQGGEPTLMGLDFFRRAVGLQRRHGAGRVVHNALQTNGTLLDDRWGEFLAREKFLVGLSLDGPRLLHDSARVGRGGQPTWTRVMAGLRVLKRHCVPFNTLTVVHRRNVRHAVEVYDFLRAHGSGFLQFIPLVERRPTAAEQARGADFGAPPSVAPGLVPWSEVATAVDRACAAPGEFGDFLIAVFDRWLRRDVGRVFVQTFDVALGAWRGQGAPLCVFQETCGRALALEHNGDVYACDHFVYPAHRLGNLHTTPLVELGHGRTADQFGQAKANLCRTCRECPVRFVCHGDCPKHRFVATAPGEPGLSYLCPSYLKFFHHIDPAMRGMAALLQSGRPASEIRPAAHGG